jgi:hypothetical protein
VLRLVAGNSGARGPLLVAACVIAGAVLYAFGFLAFVYRDWSAEALVVALMLPVLTFAYLIFPALGGAWLAGAARERFERRS